MAVLVGHVTALPLLVGALCVLAIGYRFYSAFLAAKVAVLDDTRETPAHALNDGQNYHPTNKWVLFGHHFAAISGAGPLVGPVLAAQFGYLPGLLWLVVGVVIAGATQDFLILVASIRHKGRSLAEIARAEVSTLCGRTAIVAILFIVVIALAGLGIVVKKALGGEGVLLPKNTVARAAAAEISIVDSHIRIKKDVTLVYPGGVSSKLSEGALLETKGLAILGNEGCSFPTGCSLVVKGSAWGTFTIACTIPIAFFIGLYMYRIRKGAVTEASLIGAVLVLVATWGGRWIAESPYAHFFELSGEGVTVAMMAYGFIASVLPVWLLLCPRDYLSSYLKIGTIAILVVGTLIANPKILMKPIVEEFAYQGGGPIIPGKLFPFVFITVMCGAISGFHALVASGTTPKMIMKESHARTIGYGAMLIEGLVGIVALIAVASLPPQDYFAINTRLDRMTDPATIEKLERAGFGGEDHLPALEAQVNEQLRGRTGGAVSLAVGMANVLAPEGSPFHGYVNYWYHFAIMFEALFILTTIDTGTRIARFLLQEAMGVVVPRLGEPSSLVGAVLSTSLIVACWGWLIWTGNVDTVWPMFGIANQLLAVIALSVATVWIVNQGRARYAWTTLTPLCFVVSTTSTAGYQLIQRFHGKDTLNEVLVAIMLGGVVLVLVDSARACIRKLKAGELKT
ncbi:MAG: carbon starvation protein A [Planctomycetota bacterium]